MKKILTVILDVEKNNIIEFVDHKYFTEIQNQITVVTNDDISYIFNKDFVVYTKIKTIE